jgi:hypothetical protein
VQDVAAAEIARRSSGHVAGSSADRPLGLEPEQRDQLGEALRLQGPDRDVPSSAHS